MPCCTLSETAVNRRRYASCCGREKERGKTNEMMVVMDNASKCCKENFNMKMKDDKRVSTLV